MLYEKHFLVTFGQDTESQFNNSINKVRMAQVHNWDNWLLTCGLCS